MEWGDRACAAGLKLKYVPEMIVFHPARPSLKTLLIQWDRRIQHSLTRARQNPYWRFYWTVRTCCVLSSPCIDAIRVITNTRFAMSTRLKAVAVLLIIRFYRAWRMVMLLRASSRNGVVWNREEAIGNVGTKEVRA
jgi:GT2 family glycosyltransferase